MWRISLLFTVFFVFLASCVPKQENDKSETYGLPDSSGRIRYSSSCQYSGDDKIKYPNYQDTLFFDQIYDVEIYDTVNKIVALHNLSYLELSQFEKYNLKLQFDGGFEVCAFWMLLIKEDRRWVYFIQMCDSDCQEEH